MTVYANPNAANRLLDPDPAVDLEEDSFPDEYFSVGEVVDVPGSGTGTILWASDSQDSWLVGFPSGSKFVYAKMGEVPCASTTNAPTKLQPIVEIAHDMGAWNEGFSDHANPYAHIPVEDEDQASVLLNFVNSWISHIDRYNYRFTARLIWLKVSAGALAEDPVLVADDVMRDWKGI